MTAEDGLLIERMMVTIQLHEDGVQLMRQNLRRRHPGATDDEIEERLGEWLSERPGAEHGDGVGRLGTWPPG